MTARCLDLSRLVSRVGHGPATGVDRVERAYLDALLGRGDPLFALCRTAVGYSLLDRAGVAALAALLAANGPWPPPDLAGRLSGQLPEPRRRAEAALRRLALRSCLRPGLARMLRAALPEGFSYINTGHSNLAARGLRAIRGAGGRISVLVHDTIPLDFPDFQRAGTVEGFERKLRAVSEYADLVICNSEQTRGDVTYYMTEFGRVPKMLTALLGIDPPPAPGPMPDAVQEMAPYFVTIGTIEPRKNHALLLDIWEDLARRLPAEKVPALVIVGQRGWNNEPVFRRLDALPEGGRVIELNGLDDAARTAVLAGSKGLLFPSLAEGFGLPPAEAVALGVTALCAPLPVYKEFLAHNIVYADPADRYDWATKIIALTAASEAEKPAMAAQALPTWPEHFNRVLAIV
ncbi:hypothetical protein LCGC14_0897920 [marine sediment metagenome]|uniref:Glycosyl transferase family 1 domain-containing protein n=1 Tax=marine sediment metagenome TaxID=412755 RepID=A0A0F9PI09_9ZZZZ